MLYLETLQAELEMDTEGKTMPGTYIGGNQIISTDSFWDIRALNLMC
jgi:hypothetical protein